MPKTKEEIKQYNKEYFQKNKERLRPIRQKYKEEHREEMREYLKNYLHNYYMNNKTKIVETIKKWESKNKSRIIEWRKQYNKDNKERIAINKKNYQERYKEKLAIYNRMYYINQKKNFAVHYKKAYIVNRKRNTKNYLMVRFYSLLFDKVNVPRLYTLRNELFYKNKTKIHLLLLNNHKVEYKNKYREFKKEMNDIIENDPEYIQQCEDECNLLADDYFYLSKGKLYTDWFERNLLND